MTLLRTPAYKPPALWDRRTIPETESDYGMTWDNRVTVRVSAALMEELEAYLDEHNRTKSEVVRDGIRHEIGTDERDGEIDDTVDRLEDAVDEVQREASRLQRLPLE